MPHNRAIFSTDPTTATIPNEGVTKVLVPRTPEEMEVLRYELASFVCEGEYRRGLDAILATYLGHVRITTLDVSAREANTRVDPTITVVTESYIPFGGPLGRLLLRCVANSTKNTP